VLPIGYFGPQTISQADVFMGKMAFLSPNQQHQSIAGKTTTSRYSKINTFLYFTRKH